MSRIKILDAQTANAIKAGEVIERPVSVVKELIDNAIDAAATSIVVEFEGGGISLLRVSDNGIGMDSEDAVNSFIIHATSKITSVEDLYDLSTQGFRGEALASIAACSDVHLVTRQADTDSGFEVVYSEGKLLRKGKCSADIGTVVEVSSLFSNIPARYKFLKKDSTEGMYICNLVEKLAIINPHISFKLYKDGKQILTTPGNGDMRDAIYSIYGKEIAMSLLPVEYEFEGYRISGFTGKTDLVRGNRGMQYVYVNDRCIKSQSVTAAIDEAYRNAIMKNKHAVCFLCIYAKPGMIDVNVHPQKSEVRFSNDSDVFRLVYHGIKNAVFSGNDANHVFEGIKETELPFDNPVNEESKKLRVSAPADNYVGKQLKFDTPVNGRSTPTQAESKATADMLKILSEFQPNIQEMSGSNTKDTFELEDTIVDNDNSSNIVPIIEESAPKSDIEELKNAKIVGFLFSTYIILQSDSSVFFVDQHAAHERVLYERVMNKTISNEKNIEDNGFTNFETLLVPQLLDLNAADFSYVSDNLDSFVKNGFDIEILSGRQIAIRAVPMLSKRTKPSEMFFNILNDMKKDVPDKNNIWYNLIQTTACKAAIKAHDVITVEEAYSLIEQLYEVKDPYHCAHGRPTFIKVTITEFEKNFKRIV